MNNLVDIAREIATLAHSGQYRRDGNTAYIHHPKTVAERLVDENDEVIATAWLHDVLEDTNVEGIDLLNAGISGNVMEAVIILTKSEKQSYSDYILRVKNNEIARKVKIADMLSNLSDKPTEKQIIKYAYSLLILLDSDFIIK